MTHLICNPADATAPVTLSCKHPCGAADDMSMAYVGNVNGLGTPPCYEKTATRAGTKHDGYIQEFTARMYFLRGIRARVGAGVCVMNAVALLVAHDAWLKSHRCDDNGGRVDQ